MGNCGAFLYCVDVAYITIECMRLRVVQHSELRAIDEEWNAGERVWCDFRDSEFVMIDECVRIIEGEKWLVNDSIMIGLII